MTDGRDETEVERSDRTGTGAASGAILTVLVLLLVVLPSRLVRDDA
ncbi:hypothetical protein [Nocardioides sp.]